MHKPALGCWWMLLGLPSSDRAWRRCCRLACPSVFANGSSTRQPTYNSEPVAAPPPSSAIALQPYPDPEDDKGRGWLAGERALPPLRRGAQR